MPKRCTRQTYHRFPLHDVDITDLVGYEEGVSAGVVRGSVVGELKLVYYLYEVPQDNI